MRGGGANQARKWPSLVSAITGTHRMVLLLSIAGGSIDTVIFLGFNVLTAVQTGNTVILFVSLIRGRFVNWLHAAVSLAGFVAGAAAAELVLSGSRDVLPRSKAVRLAFIGELAIVIFAFLFWHAVGLKPGMWAAAVLVVLNAVAMGVQSVTVLHLHFGPKTTYMTSTLTKFSTEMVWRLRGGKATSAETQAPMPSHENPWLYGVAWLCYGFGAAASGLLFLWLNEYVLLLPAAVIAVVIVTETANPWR